MIRRLLLLLVAVALLASGCDDEPHETLRSELRRARTVWASHAIEDYDMTLERSQQTLGGTMLVRVRDGVVASREPIGDVFALPGGDTREEAFIAENFTDVEGLFEEIRQAIDFPVDGLDVRFHPDLGYPVQARFDPTAGTVDDESRFEVLGLDVARPTTGGDAP